MCFLIYSLAYSAVRLGGRRSEHLTVTLFLMELEASESLHGMPSMPVMVSWGSQVEFRINSKFSSSTDLGSFCEEID